MEKNVTCSLKIKTAAARIEGRSVLILLSLIAISMILSVDVSAQTSKRKQGVGKRDTNEAKAWVKEYIDEMESDTSFYSTEYIVIPGTKKGEMLRAAHYYYKTMGYCSITVYTYGSGNCIDANARMIFLFTDGTKLEIEGNNAFNCENRASCALSEDELQAFVVKDLARVRIYTYKGNVEATITPEHALHWRTTMRHLSVIASRDLESVSAP